MIDENEEYVVWDKRYAVGVELIDKQHKELMRLTNVLYESCRNGKEYSVHVFKDTIKGFVDHATKHLPAEERLMEHIGYPDLAKHKAEHQGFLKEVLTDIKAFEEGKSFAPNALARFMHDWFMGHIALSDHRMGEYLAHIKTKQTLVWDKRNSIGIEAIDEQHIEIFKLTNNLYAAYKGEGKPSDDTFKAAIKSIMVYAGKHFAAEEALMKKAGYPDQAGHNQEHHRFIAKMDAAIKSFENGAVSAPHAIVRFQQSWLLEHIALYDHRMGAYILEWAPSLLDGQ
ncbi:MAG: bacteriohemerythrin [Spirochaetes bacterium]|nr:bacteriohemerythrin [Spirochaetota bacterium]